MTINTKYFIEANQLKRQDKLDEASALYHKAIEVNPNFSWSYCHCLQTKNFLLYPQKSIF